jgi:archaellum component FlaC
MKADDIFTKIALQCHKGLSVLNSMRKSVTQTHMATEQIKTDVKQLQPLLGLLTRPDELELELGNGLQKALVQIFERLDQIENSISQVLANQSLQDERIQALEAQHDRVNTHIQQVASVAALLPTLMDQVDHIRAEVQTLSADLFDGEDLVLR